MFFPRVVGPCGIFGFRSFSFLYVFYLFEISMSEVGLLGGNWWLLRSSPQMILVRRFPYTFAQDPFQLFWTLSVCRKSQPRFPFRPRAPVYNPSPTSFFSRRSPLSFRGCYCLLFKAFNASSPQITNLQRQHFFLRFSR